MLFRSLAVSARTEEEIAELPDDEKQEFLEAEGVEESGLDRLIRASYKLLGLATFFTAGGKETRAWTFKRGMKAPQVAGVIHSDFERGFIHDNQHNFFVQDHERHLLVLKYQETQLVDHVV